MNICCIRRSIIQFFAIFILFPCVQGQATKDSLTNALLKKKGRSVDYVKVLTQTAKEYAEILPDSALILSAEAMGIAKEESFDSLKSQIFISLSTAYSFLGIYDSAISYSYQAIENAKLFSDTISMIDGFNNLGIDFMYQEEDEKAVEYFLEVEQLSILFEDSLRLGHVLNNLGMMSGYSLEYDLELEYYERASFIFLKIGEEEGYANTILNSGTVFTILGQFDKAESYYEKALIEFEQLDNTSGMQNTLQSWAENAMKSGYLGKAKDLAEEALGMAKEYSLNQDVAYTYDLLEKIALERNDFKSAYEFEIKESEIREELFTREKAQQISELETKYETEKKEAEITRLSLENDLKDSRTLAIVIGGGLVIIILIVFFTLRSKKQKAEKEAQELQIEAMKKRFMELHSSPAELAVELDFEDLNKKLNTPLTEREFDALKLSIEGKTNTEIADKLFISVSTVKFHLRNTYSKMGVGNRKEAFQYMLKTS